jgi:hypothetical protein
MLPAHKADKNILYWMHPQGKSSGDKAGIAERRLKKTHGLKSCFFD